MRFAAFLRWLLVAAALVGLAGAPALAQARPAPGPAASAPAGVFIDPQPGEAFVHLNHLYNTAANQTNLEHPALNGNPNARLLVTNQIFPYTYPADRVDHPIGVYYDTSANQWAIYTDDVTNIITPAAWNVFIPPADSGLMLHTTAAGNISGTATLIDHGLFNGDPNAILFVQHVYNPPGGFFTYFTQTVSVAYDTGLGQWKIMNNDGSAMPENISFFVYGASADEKSYRHITSPSNSYLTDGTLLDNLYTNGNPDAQILVTQNFGTGVTNTALDRRLGLFYDSFLERWVIFNQTADGMPDGVMFNVLVIPPTTGAFLHQTTSANTLLHVSGLGLPDLNANRYARIYVTHNWNPADLPNELYNDHPLGVAYSTDHWVIFNRDGAPLPLGSTYNVYYTLPRTNSIVASASPTNTVTTTLTLNNPLLNNQPGALAITTFNSTPNGSSGAPYSGNTGVHYQPGPVGFWQIFNRLGPDFPMGLSYNFLIPPAGSSFIHTATVGNILGNATYFNNPLTDDNPYALVFVTPRDNGGMNEHNLGVYRLSNTWAIFNEGLDAIQPGTQYNVFVYGRSAIHMPAVHR